MNYSCPGTQYKDTHSHTHRLKGLKKISFMESEPTVFGGSKRSPNAQPSGLAQVVMVP